MCAIVGFYKKHNCAVSFTEYAQHALTRMSHRGSDSVKIINCKNITDNVCLGHSRLSIIGLDNGTQPITDGDITIAVNGEFYDYQYIRALLCSDYQFKTDTDSEIIIPLYRKYGIDGMMKYLNGEFSFLLYDNRIKTLYACRDRFGIKPLVYRDNKDFIEIASEAKAFNHLELDIDSIIRTTSMHYQALDKTFYKDIKQVKPGHYLTIKNGNINSSCYYNLAFRKRLNHYSTGELHNKIYNAVVRRLRSDVPICCHLSGGLDSSAVAGIIANTGRQVDAFSIVFPEYTGIYDESKTIERTAKFCNANLHKIFVTQSDILKHFDDAIRMSEGVAVNGHISCKYLLNKAIHSAGFKVALTGEGADECFSGYSHIKQDLGIGSSMSIMAGTETPDGDMLDTSAIKDVLGYVPSFLQAKFSMGYKFRKLMSADFKQLASTHDIAAELVDELELKKYKFKDKAESTMHIWYRTALANYILRTLGDGCEMQATVEGRLPFLDYELVDYVASMSLYTKFDFHTGIEKKWFRHVVGSNEGGKYITNEVYKRPKQPFQAPPITQFFTDTEWDLVSDILLSKKFTELGFFDKISIEKLLQYIKSGDTTIQTVYEPIIMLLLSINSLNNTLR